MSFVGRILQKNRFHNFGSCSLGKTFKGASSLKQNHHFSFRRSFHEFTKRPRISYSNKWNVYDEMKLFSYSSHLAFFMLLPPIIQMYTTKVEVTRDDTLEESPFGSLDSGNGITIRNINISDMLHIERDKLLKLYFQSEPATSILPETDCMTEKILKDKKEKQINSNDIERDEYYDPEFSAYLKKLSQSYDSLKRNNINNEQYYANIERITDCLMNMEYKKTKEGTNNVLMKIFDQFHSLRLHKYEIQLFRRILTTVHDPNVKLLSIRQKIISNYESIKAKEHKSISTSLSKLISSSKWLTEYASNFERFAQLIEMFAITKQNNKAFISLINVGLRSEDVREKIKNSHLRYGLVSVLRGYGREKEAYFLEKRMRKQITL
ncbi:hypothetical protein CANINC_000475 [Pichia inconspicua]|uniref:Uncharacterized protein n=1 Tax=Pichia inconspicua TaxID=52247 RepID=A0A4T0X6J1_9ASCO|nr:hypothetical protein CANINC_000475 [[Candida] inconspicua]